MTEVARDLTTLGSLSFLALLTAAIAGFLWLRGMFAAMLLLLAATIGGLTVNMMLKLSFDRPRPQIVPHLTLTHTSSFPSGHAMLSATVFLTLGVLLGRFVEERVLKAYFLILAVILTVLVGISRVYLGVHDPTDVLTGWAAGLAWAILCWLIARIMQRRHIVESDAS
jgi:undecaprenyl-diphosphatase